MSDQPIINISNLSCSYTSQRDEKVLFIDHLVLHKGKIIFLLGASGTGKSTLLETLGLMNNTISSGTIELISPDNIKYDYARLWKNNDSKEINTIRKNFLSFIFQNTNLMENFTAYENICLSQMIKNNAVQSKAMDGAVKLMRQVSLPEAEVGYDTLSVNLSGGQRQRISFVRALNSEFKLLLCDEPTGNLDEVNAHELLNIVKQNLSSDKTAILVSHDVNLALKYADQIILITKNQEKGYGEILEKNIFQREYWTSMQEAERMQFRSSIVELFLPAKKQIDKVDTSKIEAFKKEKSYVSLFLQKEGKVLRGKSYVNLLVLISIMSLTFLAIGFANGALHYLNNKIKDPFVNWITIKLPGIKSDAETVNGIKEQLNTDKIKKDFLISSVTAYKETPLPLFPADSKESEFSKGRILSYDDPISKDLFKYPDNLIRGDSSFKGENDLGIVVTAKLLKRLGYPDDAKVIYLDNNDKDITTNNKSIYRVPIPIRAVIKEIPNRNYFLITDFFHRTFNTHEDCIFDYNMQSKRIILFAGNDKDFIKQLEEEIKKNFSKLTDGTFTLDDLDIEHEKSEQLTEKGMAINISFNTKPDSAATTERLYAKIMALPLFEKNKDKIIRLFDYDSAPLQQDKIIYDYLSINFTGLDRIESFSKYINKTLNSGSTKEESNIVEIDAGTIKEKNNFNYMSKMTLLIATLLIAFSILAISLFISNLLKTHLNKIKSNLGTYKAFGLSDKESINIYLYIMIRFIAAGLFISLVISYVLGKLTEKAFASQLKIEDQAEYFRLFDIKTYLLISVIIVVTIVVSYININKTLSKTPGDLIYNR